MAEALSATLTLGLNIQHTFPVGLQNVNASIPNIDFTQTFINGTGAAANEINEVYAAERVLALSATENLDLASGTLVNAARPSGSVIFNRVKMLLIVLPDVAGQASSITVGGVAAAGFISPFGDATDKVNIVKGGALLLYAVNLTAFGVTATTADLLKILNNDGVNAATYKVYILGNKP